MTWDGLAERLEGRIVTLEPLTERHAPALWEAAQDPEIWRWMPADGSRRPEFERLFTAALDAAARGVEAPFAVVVGGEPVGSTRYLSLRPEHRGLEIGFTWYRRDLWGAGVNVESKLLLLEHAFERLGCWRVEFKTDARNERSRAALAALPAQFEGVFRKHMAVRGGERRDSAYYSVIDDDWPAVRANLELRLGIACDAAPLNGQSTRLEATHAPRHRFRCFSSEMTSRDDWTRTALLA